jgi:hypothetical protein
MGQCSSSKSTDNSIKSTCTNLNVLSKIFTEDIPIDSDQSGGLQKAAFVCPSSLLPLDHEES